VEDYEVLYRLHRMSGLEERGWRVKVIAGARGVTDAPGAVGQFLRQRARWFGGFLATFFHNCDMVGDGRFGGMGRQLLPVKTVDTLLPFFAATAQISLIYLVLRGGFLDGFLLAILGVKFAFDLCLHAWALRLYACWLGLPFGAGALACSLAASLLEPFCFQPLRYTGALSGWVAFLCRNLTWESQRLGAVQEPVRERN
jgi:cellulose synthase/poly-beta-1,6-N-acetylglucosamine synthase-like glycosyltransferase